MYRVNKLGYIMNKKCPTRRLFKVTKPDKLKVAPSPPTK